MSAKYILAIDQGTTSSRAIVFDRRGRPLAVSQRELPQIYPQDGWVEQDPEFIWSDVAAVCRMALDRAGLRAADLAGLGVTNQRETTLLWERETGRPLYNAIVWQDRRTADRCRELKQAGLEKTIRERTGLLLDPYFSAAKLAWLLDSLPGARERARRGELAFGTVDSFLLFRLTGGRVHATDATNASRTMLFNIQEQKWDRELLEIFDIPDQLLPTVMDNCADYGLARPEWLGGEVPILAMVGDQQAALAGQACFEPGMIKSTYGTGCFVLMNTGPRFQPPARNLLTTVAYRLQGQTCYAVEGSIFAAGAAVQWLRDGLGIIDRAAETSDHAEAVEDAGGVYLVPAFTGLGAPYWDPDARGAILGITRDVNKSHIIRAALEAQAYQTWDLLEAMAGGWGQAPAALRVDGGMAANDWMCGFLADITGLAVERPLATETTALGAACLAGLGAGLYSSLEDVAGAWRRDRLFEPRMDPKRRERLLAGWRRAVSRVTSRRPPAAGDGLSS